MKQKRKPIVISITILGPYRKIALGKPIFTQESSGIMMLTPSGMPMLAVSLLKNMEKELRRFLEA